MPDVQFIEAVANGEAVDPPVATWREFRFEGRWVALYRYREEAPA